MPIVINEIEIAVEVTPGQGSNGAGGAQLSGSSKEEIIKECVEKVMELLTLKNER